MSRFKESMKRAEKSFLGTFGEPILYNGTEITGIDELGPSWKDKLPSGSGGSSSPAKFSVSVQEVPHPKVGDEIRYEGEIYQVVLIGETDGVIHTLECSTGKSMIYRRQ